MACRKVKLNTKKYRIEEKTLTHTLLVNRVLSLLPLEDELERMKSPPLSSVISSDSLPSTAQENEDDKSSSSPYVVVPGNSYDDYFHEAQERFHYALLAKNFWQTPYPPVKSKKDIETEDRKSRLLRPKSMMNDAAADQMSISSTVTNTTTTNKNAEAYEGLFLSRIFAQFCRMFELPVEQNLLVTSILQKLAGVVDKRMDGVICDWRSIRVGNDGVLYGGVWTLPSTKVNRRSLYALLEQVIYIYLFNICSTYSCLNLRSHLKHLSEHSLFLILKLVYQ